MSKGVKYILMATFLFAIMNLLVKSLPHLPAVEIVFFRSVISLFISAGMLRAQNVPLMGNNKPILLLRGIFGTCALIMIFTTLQNVPLATSTTLFYLSPIFTTLIVGVVLGEKIKKIQWLFFAISFAGVVLIKGFDPDLPLLYFLLGIGGALMASAAYTCVRKLKTSEHPLVIILYFPMVAMPTTLLLSWFNWEWPQGVDWLLLLGIGLLTQAAQFFLTKAYQIEAAAKVASANYVGIVYAILFGYLFFGEFFSFEVIMGMLLVIVGVVLNVAFPWLSQQWRNIRSS